MLAAPMRFRLSLPTLLLLAWLALLLVARAAPVPINNASFERPILNSGSWINTLADPDLVGNGSDWLGQAGNNNGATFIEYIPTFSAEGNQHLGMQNNYYVFQNTGVQWAPKTRYELTVGVGDRSEPAGALAIIGLTHSSQVPGPTNSLPYANTNDALVNDPLLAEASRAVDFGGTPNLTFTDFTLTYETGATSPIGYVVVFLGDDATSHRSHFDHVRLTSTLLADPEPPTVANVVPAEIGGTVANPGADVTDAGGDLPEVTLYYSTADGGTDSSAWTSSTVMGTFAGAQTGYLTGLTPNTIYYFRAFASNVAGTAWASATESFTTGAIDPGNVVINELHYNPIDNTSAEEFVEIHNSGDVPIDISGWRLNRAIDFTFPADTLIPARGYLVIAEDLARIQTLFGISALGPYSGGLSGRGEDLELEDASGLRMDYVDYGVGFPWPTGSDGAGSSMELVHPELDNDLGGSWRAGGTVIAPNTPTPGAVNSVFSASVPPQIRQVEHLPKQPTATEKVVITAKITDPDGMGPVTLSYQLVNPGTYIRRTDAVYETSWTTVAMLDDGTSGDAIAGDFVYSLTMPTSLHNHRRLVRYRLHIEDSLGNASSVPYADDESPNFAYYVYDGVPAWTGADRPGVTPTKTFPASLMESMPVYQLIANETDVTNSQYNGSSDGVHMFGTMVYEGKVYDHITFENRGEASTYQSGKNKWRFRFNRTRDFEARDQWGKKYESPWDDLNFDSCASPWAPVHRGMAGIDEAISYRLFALAGMASPSLHHVHFRVVDDAAEAPSDQYAGDLWGLYTAIEQPDGSFLDDRDLPDGNVYKIEGGGGDKKHQGAMQPTNSSDWSTFAGNSGSTQTEAYWRSNMNLQDYYTFRGCNRILGNVDVRAGYNHYFYHHPNGQWQVMPWDLDMMFIAETHWPGVIQQEACLNIPAIDIEFKNRCRELLDLICSDARDEGGQIGQLIDEYADIVNPPGQEMTWSDIDQYMWNFHPRTRGTIGNASGQGNHKGNFFVSPFQDSRFGGQWTRTLISQDHEGSVEYIRDYTTDTYTGVTWAPGNGIQNGYGYEFLAQEASDASIPLKPTIAHAGSSFATNDLTFSTSAFVDPQGTGTFGAIKWRVAEIANPSTPGYDLTTPRKYEIEAVWESAEITPFANVFTVPPAEIREGCTYRVRARHRDTSGRWSHWSDAIQFVAGAPDLTVWINHLMITELMYHPVSASASEIGLGYSDSDFEFLELQNISTSSTLDLTELRFTKGVNFDFVNGTITSLSPGEFVLLARNLAAFELRYGTGLPVAGAYGPDKLSNGGEQLKLSFGAGSAIHDFTYDDTFPWPIAPDGLGYSLKLIDPKSAPDHSLSASWTGSSTFGGTPGEGEPPAFEIWQVANFTPTELLDLAVSGPQADPDYDGYPNVIEFGAGVDPKIGGDVPDIESSESQDGLVLTRPRGNSGVIWMLELSDALGQWYFNGDGSGQVFTQDPITLDLGNGQETLTFRSVTPLMVHDRHFFRLRARLVE